MYQPFRGLVSVCAAVMLGGAALSCGPGDPPSPTVPAPRAHANPGTYSPSRPLRVVLFYAPFCEMCHAVDQRLPAIEEKWGPRIRIEKLMVTGADSAKLRQFEAHYGYKVTRVPVAFVGREVIGDGAEIIQRLHAVIEQELRQGALTFEPYEKSSLRPERRPTCPKRGPPASSSLALACVALTTSVAPATAADSQPATQPSTRPAEGIEVEVRYYTSQFCESCQRVKKWLGEPPEPWPEPMRVVTIDIGKAEGLNDFLTRTKQLEVPAPTVPAVIVGQRCLVGEKDVMNGLRALVDERIATLKASDSAVSQPAATQPTSQPGAIRGEPGTPRESDLDRIVPAGIRARFETFTVPAVAAAGLLDGVNPCAFTTIVFMLSMLTYLGRSRRQMLAAGVAFALGVLGTYFLLGLGLLTAYKAFAVRHGLSVALAYAVALLAFALAGWSLVDYLRYRRSHDVNKVTLGLPKSIKRGIHRVIRVGLAAPALVAGAAAVGVLVSLLESLCTGQVYLPTIVLLTRSPALRGHAIGYLLLYNVMFILPLLIVLVVAYFGVRSERLGQFLRAHLAGAKLAMAILFASLGALVIGTTL